MAKTRHYKLGNLQLQIMQALWDVGPSAVAEVQQALPAPGDLAYTTVATMLRKMEDKGLVEHRAEGRRFIYRPLVESGEVSRSMAGDLLERLFEGSLTDMVSHLLSTREIGRDELDSLEALIAAQKQRRSETPR